MSAAMEKRAPEPEAKRPGSSSTVASRVARLPLRARLLIAVASVVTTVALAVVLYNEFIGSRSVSTENAYVGAEIAQVTPQIAGTVAKVLVSDATAVKAGDVLVELDGADAVIALAAAKAELAQAERSVGEMRATGDALSATVTAREADLKRADDDLTRREALARRGATPREELDHAREAARSATAALAAARAQLDANRLLAGDEPVDQHPDVLRARAHLDQAELDQSRTVIRAPIDGIIAKRNVQIGQRVSPGAALMAVVPINRVYVDANFKESQLERVAVGQEVTLTSDLYGSDVVYKGRVIGLGGGTGSAFALIPAQNATGNWIKVVQRLPVRIALDPETLARHPLRVGLSMRATIHLKRAPAAPPAAS